MTDSTPITLYYVHDPMCSWCWGFRPTWMRLKQLLPPHIRVVSLLGGLAADSDEPMPLALRNTLMAAWQRIQHSIPGTEFNYDFWALNTPRRSTYPACRAVLAAGLLADRRDEMTLGIQQAYYLHAKNPSDPDILSEVAGGIGLDIDDFNRLMTSDKIEQLFEKELAQVHSLGVHSFPSLVLQQGEALDGVHLDYASAENMQNHINQLLSSY